MIKSTKVKAKAVAQYLDGVLVAKYPSIATASLLTETQSAHIGKVAGGLRKTAGGSAWKFTRFDGQLAKTTTGLKQMDAITGEVLAIFRDETIASEVLGISVKQIVRVLGDSRRSVQGYTFA